MAGINALREFKDMDRTALGAKRTQLLRQFKRATAHLKRAIAKASPAKQEQLRNVFLADQAPQHSVIAAIESLLDGPVPVDGEGNPIERLAIPTGKKGRPVGMVMLGERLPRSGDGPRPMSEYYRKGLSGESVRHVAAYDSAMRDHITNRAVAIAEKSDPDNGKGERTKLSELVGGDIDAHTKDKIAGLVREEKLQKRIASESLHVRRGKNQVQHLRTIASQGGKASAAEGHSDAEIIAAFKAHKAASRKAGITCAVETLTHSLGYADCTALWKRVKQIAAPLRPSTWYKTL
jgi:hypothetical protein